MTYTCLVVGQICMIDDFKACSLLHSGQDLSLYSLAASGGVI